MDILANVVDAKVPLWKVAISVLVCGATYQIYNRVFTHQSVSMSLPSEIDSENDDGDEEEVEDGEKIRNNYGITNGKFKMVSHT